MSDVVDKALALREGLKAWLEKDRYLHDGDPTESPSLQKAFRDNWDRRVGGEKFGGVWSIAKAKSNGDHPASEEANTIPKADWSKRTVTVDHAIPVRVLFDLFWRAETRGDMERVTDAYWVAVITKDENDRLNAAGLKQEMPKGWHFGDDPRARWNEVNIDVPDVQQRKSLGDRRREHAAWVIGQIVEWRAEGKGYRRIAARLNRGGVAAPRGGTWQANQVRRIWDLVVSESLQYALPMGESEAARR